METNYSEKLISLVASAFSNFKSGQTYGYFFDFGDFEKCINFKSNEIQGKHCLVQYYSALSDILPAVPKDTISKDVWKDANTRLFGSLCIPSICDENKLVPKLMETIFNGTKYVMSSDYNQDDFCQTKKNFKVTASGIFGMSIILFILALALFSTIKCRKNKSTIFSSFCLVRNFKNLFIDENRDETFRYIRGLKALTFLSSAIIHAFVCVPYIPSNNPEKVTKFYSEHVGLFMTLAMPASTLFWFITHFFITINLWKVLNKKGSFNIWKLYVYRYLRITPTMLFFLVIHKFVMQNWVATILQRPHFFPNVYFRNYKFYWLPLLHLQNYFVDVRETVSDLS